MPSLRAVVAFLFGLVLLALPAHATWSIVIVDLVTGEVAVAISTCLTGFDLRPNTVVVVPGYGAAAAQSFVGPLSLRELIRTGLLSGTQANQILAQLSAADPGFQTRQYGIVGLTNGATTFTGTGAGAWAGGVTGQVGSLVYAIQGNVLTGQPVVTLAEQALLNTPGTLGDKLMAAMLAARNMGGDGRCSCSATAPTSCGSPPPSFTKASHIALMIWSRPSDVDVPCNGVGGCGGGDYWLDLNIANQQASSPDPILTLQTLYAQWVADQVGRPDHYTSTVTMSSPTLRANGVDTVTGTVVLRDAQGNPLGNSLPITVGLRSGSTVTGVTLGAPVPQPNGSYTFTMTGNVDAGDAILDVAVHDQFGRVGIWPQPVVHVTDAFGPCGVGAIPNGAGGVHAALRIDGNAGVDRVVEVGYGQPFTLSLDAPPGGATTFPVGMFALWGHVGLPALANEVPLGAGNGSLCFTPSPFEPSAPTVLLADSFGIGGVVFAGPAPWTLPIPGVQALVDVTLQGVMVVDPTARFAATNAVLLRTVALPPPTITNVVPQSPLPGQTVALVGSDFRPGMLAAVAGVPVAVTVLGSTQATFPMPIGAPCDAQLLVANLGTSAVQRVINGTPVITTQTITSGPAAGGTLMILAGQFLGGASVTFNGVPMTITSQTNGSIIGTTPPGTPGPATLRVTNPNGCQTTLPFTYL